MDGKLTWPHILSLSPGSPLAANLALISHRDLYRNFYFLYWTRPVPQQNCARAEIGYYSGAADLRISECGPATPSPGPGDVDGLVLRAHTAFELAHM